MVLTVQVGDIAAAVDVDVVVVSANTFLDLEGGGARALAKVCGPSLAVELAAARTRGAVRVPDVVVTGAGHHKTLRRILWAVVRDYERTSADDDSDDPAAVETGLRRVWAEVLSVAAGQPLRVGIIPIGAQDIGVAASAALIASTLTAARLPPAITVTLWTTDARHVDTIERALARQRIDDAGAALATHAAPPRPAPLPPASAPLDRSTTTGPLVMPAPATPAPAPAVPTARSKQQVVGDAVIETFDRCSGPAPVGCMGVLFKVRRRGGPSMMQSQLQSNGPLEDLAIDGVPVDGAFALQKGAHVLTCTILPGKPPFFFGGTLAGVERIGPPSGVRATRKAPPSGWRQPDFDDSDWFDLVKDRYLLGLPAGEPQEGRVWLRWPFHSTGEARR